MEKLKHVALIVDGNGRWAKERGKSRSEGHLEGAKNLEKIILHTAKNTEIEVLSLYVFSTENFKRDKKEVDYLMNLFLRWFKTCKKKYKTENIKIIFSGRKKPLSDNVYKSMKNLEKETKDNTGLIVNLCLNYGGRSEIVDTAKKLAEKVLKKELELEDITEEVFSDNLYQKLPDVDFVIRTSGEQRISNFLLWEISYAEFVFVKTYFPDLTTEEFDNILKEYSKRDRRFGKIKEK